MFDAYKRSLDHGYRPSLTMQSVLGHDLRNQSRALVEASSKISSWAASSPLGRTAGRREGDGDGKKICSSLTRRQIPSTVRASNYLERKDLQAPRGSSRHIIYGA